MRLERASAKAIRYAIMNWHYSKAVPNVGVAYAVFNGAGEWCGVVCYGIGATSNIAEPYGMNQGQVIELVRVALNGKQEATSKAVAVSLKQLRKDCPLVEMVVSYADSDQGHMGIIYQASNWIYTMSSVDTDLIIDGVRRHRRSLSSLFGTSSKEKLESMGMQVQVKRTQPKYKYVYPLTKQAKATAEAMRKPYPKKPAPEAQTDERLSSTQEDGGAVPTPALTYSLP